MEAGAEHPPGGRAQRGHQRGGEVDDGDGPKHVNRAGLRRVDPRALHRVDRPAADRGAGATTRQVEGEDPAPTARPHAGVKEKRQRGQKVSLSSHSARRRGGWGAGGGWRAGCQIKVEGRLPD
eukprot:6791422-Prymnesium_polylepis.1